MEGKKKKEEEEEGRKKVTSRSTKELMLKKNIDFARFKFFLWISFGVKALLNRDILRSLQNFTSREIILFMTDVG